MSLICKTTEEILEYIKTSNIITLCRFCLCHESKMHSLSSVVSICDSIQFNIQLFCKQYLELQISESDNSMPNKMCASCATQLSAAYKFKNLCNKADEILRNCNLIKDNDGSTNSTDKDGIDIKNKLFDHPNECKSVQMHKRKLKLSYKKCTSNMDPKKIKHKAEESNIISNVSSESKLFSNDSTFKIIGNFLCQTCGDYFTSSNALQVHICNSKISRSIPNASIYNVSHLAAGFNTNQDLKNATERDLLFENKTDSISSDEIDLTDTQCSEEALSCTVCEERFITSHDLELHASVHNNLKSATYVEANMSLVKKKRRVSHLGDKPFKCSYCDKKFAQRKPLQYHEKTHTGERPHVCDVCGKSYIQPNNLVIHKRSHTGEKPFVCKECGKAFTNGASLTLHMPVHTGIKDFVCTICGKRMARSGELTIHMRTHTGEKPYVCRTCSKAFIKKSSLQAHMYSHTGEKKFVCPICGHRVAQAGKLTVHIRTHSTNKPFACPICDRKFANQGYLKQHSKIHSGERSKPHVCSFCGRAFAKNRNLTEHMRLHTGERPYVCLLCNHSFGQRSTLNFHMKSAHGETKSKIIKITDGEIGPEKVLLKPENVIKSDLQANISSESSNVKLEIPKAAMQNDSEVPLPIITSVIQSNTRDFISMRNTGSQNVTDDIKPSFDPRLHYDSKLLGFSTYNM